MQILLRRRCARVRTKYECVCTYFPKISHKPWLCLSPPPSRNSYEITRRHKPNRLCMPNKHRRQFCRIPARTFGGMSECLCIHARVEPIQFGVIAFWFIKISMLKSINIKRVEAEHTFAYTRNVRLVYGYTPSTMFTCRKRGYSAVVERLPPRIGNSRNVCILLRSLRNCDANEFHGWSLKSLAFEKDCFLFSSVCSLLV